MKTLPMALALALASGPVLAQRPENNAVPPPSYAPNAETASVYSDQPVYAEVISSRPDYRQVKINVPGRQVCRDEAVTGAVSADSSTKTPAAHTRCETQYDSHFEQRQVGYDVTYRYDGQVYHTHLVRDPGSQLQVDVSVTPAADAGPSY